MYRIDISGCRFGRLTAVDRSKTPYSPWRCQCDCGNEVVVDIRALRSGNTKSCGCWQRQSASQTNTTHGRVNTATYHSWTNMLQRCTNPNNPWFPDYGGRGIMVCAQWRKFENFLADMGERPPGRTLEREDNNGNYEANNCRWASSLEQGRNKRNSRWVTYRGETLILAEWARRFNIDASTLRRNWIKQGVIRL